jgi:acyl-CoA dehydrogenase
LIDFKLEPEFEADIQWIRSFLKSEVEPLDLAFNYELFSTPYDINNAPLREKVKRLQDKVRARGLWGLHLDHSLGGQGLGQVKLCFVNEWMGRSSFGPVVFGCHGPDSGNSEILARYGTKAQKERYLQPLLDNEIFSCFSMTEPTGGADPTQFVCRAVREDNAWVINGEKWFASHAKYAAFLIVMAVTDPDAPPHRRMSTFIVPRESPGIDTIRETGLWGEEIGVGAHAYLRYKNVRVPLDHLLGEEGGGFKVAQARLGGGRIHHAMRTVGLCQRAVEMMVEHAANRKVRDGVLGDRQSVAADIATSWIELEQFRLLVLKAAWYYDQADEKNARLWTAAVKVASAKVSHDIVWRAMHMHGALGLSNELPFNAMLTTAAMLGIADGPTEVHRDVIARTLLKAAPVREGLFPSEHLIERRKAARARFADILGEVA